MDYQVKDDSGRKSGEPHPDWKYNSQVIKGLIRQNNFKEWCENNRVSYIYRGVNPKKCKNIWEEEYEVLTHVEFSFIKNEKFYVDPLSFHQSIQEFSKQLEIRFCNFMKKL